MMTIIAHNAKELTKIRVTVKRLNRLSNTLSCGYAYNIQQKSQSQLDRSWKKNQHSLSVRVMSVV